MQQLPPRRRTGEDPLFTDFTASNIGTLIHCFLTMRQPMVIENDE